MADFRNFGVDEDTIREYQEKYGDDAEKMLRQHFGNREQQEGTSQQAQGNMSDQP